MQGSVFRFLSGQHHAAGGLRFQYLQIGELANRGLSAELTAAHPDIPWRQINGMRNRIVHGYEGVQLRIVWETITESFPPLIASLEAIRKTL